MQFIDFVGLITLELETAWKRVAASQLPTECLEVVNQSSQSVVGRLLDIAASCFLVGSFRAHVTCAIQHRLGEVHCSTAATVANDYFYASVKLFFACTVFHAVCCLY